MAWLSNLLLVLANGAILFYFSELAFWARPRPGDTITGWLSTWLLYSLMGFILLAVMQRFRVRHPAALFQAGALFGWLTEGVIVQTMYESFPLQISFTGLAWHTLISVMLGWYLLRKILLENRPVKTILVSTLVGIGYGLWSLSWWVEEPERITSPALFGSYILASTVMLAGAYWLYDRTASTPFRPPAWSLYLTGGLFLLYFVFVSVPSAPLAPVVLPPLLLVVFMTLNRNLRQESQPGLVTSLTGQVCWLNYLGVLFIAIAAWGIYAAAYELQLRLPTHWGVYLCTTPLGFILFVLSAWRIWRRKSTDG